MYEKEFDKAVSRKEFVSVIAKKYPIQPQTAERAWYRFSKEQRKEKEKGKNIIRFRRIKYKQLYDTVKGDREKFLEQIQVQYGVSLSTAKRQFFSIRYALLHNSDATKSPKTNIQIQNDQKKELLLKLGQRVLREKVDQSTNQIIYPLELTKKPNMFRLREYEDMSRYLNRIPKREELRRLGFREYEINWLENFESQKKGHQEKTIEVQSNG